ncbi:Do family serine endopeptidase [Luteimonas sp. MJ293]|uniref:Do family serine endopeptidase n=1 Tax=Luteimonas sp. MJ146 TaxID=3129240 RepID=UPI0031BB6227
MRPLPTLLALVAAAAFGGLVATLLRDLPPSALAQPAAVELADPAWPAARPTPVALPVAIEGQALPSLAPMLEQVTPAVLSVHTRQRVRTQSPFGNDPFFRRMFPELAQERINESLGSGVIVDAERGLVLTNHHVIEVARGAEAVSVSVSLSDGRTMEAEFIGSDPETDIALMRIPAENLTAVPLADSSTLQVGDFVVAVGNPFGFSQTVTSGIVSAVGRSNVPGVGYQNFIQTDASINPGNSGGALVNLRGELVGINTASFNAQGSMAGNIGLGFAIPSNLAGSVMRQLYATGEVRRGTLGIDTQTVDPELARGLELEAPRGAVVTRVHAGSSSAAGGLRAGDVIISANGQRIDNSESLRNFQGLQPLDTEVSLEVIRDGRTITVSARLMEVPRDGASYDPRLAGATLADLPEALRRSAGERVGGVRVESVDSGSRAERNGLRAGDLILASSGGPFRDLAGFRAALSESPEDLLLIIQRGRSRGQVQLQ